MSKPILAVVGRPNVGKSTFFNRIIGERKAIVQDTPGVTRDRIYAETEWNGREFAIVDTGGIEANTSDVILSQMREQAVTAMELADVIAEIVDKGDRNKLSSDYPLVILMIGINGGGKTTSIGKLANMFKERGHSVLLAAADTFRAAAADQLVEWGNRSGVRVIRHEEGTDPAAVIYDAVQSARANDIDVLICDTAGRLQNKTNLMKELEKMDKIISREYPEASRETLIVLDSTTGKNAISQAKEFSEIADITGIVLTKLDGTARGGISITVTDEYDLPIKFIGVGEGIHDLKEFDPKEFAGGIFDE